jgi:hypothetical protein
MTARCWLLRPTDVTRIELDISALSGQKRQPPRLALLRFVGGARQRVLIRWKLAVRREPVDHTG